MTRILLTLILCSCLGGFQALGQYERDVAREWNEVLLEAIRNDYARPTVHARNLFHTSVVMYDAWAAYDTTASTYFLGQHLHGFPVPFEGVALPDTPEAIEEARRKAMSYAAYRLLQHRFEYSPGASHSLFLMDSLFNHLGYDANVTSWNYQSGDPAALGNYIAAYMINYGQQDGANELNDYANRFYEPVNPPLDLEFAGNPDLIDPNRWQPLKFDTFVDQSGNLILGGTPAFLSPEWGSVHPFSLDVEAVQKHERDSGEYWIYHDPGPPPYIDTTTTEGSSELYKWGFELVAVWSGHLDPEDSTMWDISPNNIGNIPFESFPDSFAEYPGFYNLTEGGDASQGYSVNPKTGQPYEPQWVRRGDYARVLAEFWADGPDSETPPGHWYTILNTVMDHPDFQPTFKGEGSALPSLEYEVKAYLTLGGAMHDVAIVSWGLKGWYDYIRPISAFRYIGQIGQSSDPNLPYYHPAGVRLVPGHIELIDSSDALAGNNYQHVGKVKVKAWKGHEYIFNAELDVAGVDWIRPRKWWPYQRPSFVTPPFAGYVSGHSTYSRAAAEVLTELTGDPYFPGGVGRFVAPKDDFLKFERGPSDTIVLEWAKYYDASDQCSLSRIWGGIHPPADDIPGRKLGREIGLEAFARAEELFQGDSNDTTNQVLSIATRTMKLFPNPAREECFVSIPSTEPLHVSVMDASGRIVKQVRFQGQREDALFRIGLAGMASGVYYLMGHAGGEVYRAKLILL